MISGDIITRVKTIITNTVPVLSGGRFQVSTIETGSTSRPATRGWVQVLFQKVLPSTEAGGQATVGGGNNSQGTIWLKYDPTGPAIGSGTTSDPRCGWAVVGAADHEVVHTMGY